MASDSPGSRSVPLQSWSSRNSRPGGWSVRLLRCRRVQSPHILFRRDQWCRVPYRRFRNHFPRGLRRLRQGRRRSGCRFRGVSPPGSFHLRPPPCIRRKGKGHSPARSLFPEVPQRLPAVRSGCSCSHWIRGPRSFHRRWFRSMADMSTFQGRLPGQRPDAPLREAARHRIFRFLSSDREVLPVQYVPGSGVYVLTGMFPLNTRGTRQILCSQSVNCPRLIRLRSGPRPQGVPR